MFGPSPRTLPDKTQHSQETDFHCAAGFEPEIPPSEQALTHALDRAATGIVQCEWKRTEHYITSDLRFWRVCLMPPSTGVRMETAGIGLPFYTIFHIFTTGFLRIRPNYPDRCVSNPPIQGIFCVCRRIQLKCVLGGVALVIGNEVPLHATYEYT